MWKEAPNGEGSYWDPDAYDESGRWWTEERAARIAEIDRKILTEDGQLRTSFFGDEEEE